MAIGDRAWRDRAEAASAAFYTTPEALAKALRDAARILVKRGEPFRLCERSHAPDLSPWMVDRLEVFAVALGRLAHDDPLAHAAIERYDLPGTWPRSARWCRPLACSFDEAREVAWRGWIKMASVICENGAAFHAAHPTSTPGHGQAAGKDQTSSP